MTLLVIFLIGFLLRLAYSASEESSDEWVSFWHISRQKNQRWVNYGVDRKVNDGTYGYPVLSHFIIAKFPEHLWGLAGRLLNILPDLAVGVFLWAALYILFPGLPDYALNLMMLVYFFTPALLPLNSRMIAIKARSFGFMLYVIAMGFCVVMLYSAHFKIVSGIGAAAVYVAIMLSSMFAFQVATFSLIGLSLAYFSLLPLLVMCAGLAIAFVFKSLRAWEPLRFWWAHKRWYLKHKENRTTAAGRNNLKNLLRIPAMIFKNPGRAARTIFRDNSYISLLYLNPCLIILAYILITRGFPGSNSIAYCFFVLVLINLAAFFITSLERFSHYGQAERYMEYAVPFYIIVYAALALQMPPEDFLNYTLLLLSLSILGTFFNMVYLNGRRIIQSHAPVNSAEGGVIEWLKANADQKSIGCIPMKLSQYFSFFDQGAHKYYYRLLLRESEKEFEEYATCSNGLVEAGAEGFIKDFEAFGASPARLRELYNIDHIIVRSDYLSGYQKTAGDEFGNLEQVFSNGRYSIFRLSGG